MNAVARREQCRYGASTTHSTYSGSAAAFAAMVRVDARLAPADHLCDECAVSAWYSLCDSRLAELTRELARRGAALDEDVHYRLLVSDYDAALLDLRSGLPAEWTLRRLAVRLGERAESDQ